MSLRDRLYAADVEGWFPDPMVPEYLWRSRFAFQWDLATPWCDPHRWRRFSTGGDWRRSEALVEFLRPLTTMR